MTTDRSDKSNGLPGNSTGSDFLCDNNERISGTPHPEDDSVENCYKDLFLFAPVAYITTDKTGLILEANQRAHNLLEESGNNLSSKLLSQFVTLDDQLIFADNMTRLFETRQPASWLMRMRRNDGNILQISMNASIMPHEALDSVCLMVLTDVTGSVTSEETLRENEHFLRKSQEAAHIGSYSTDLTTRIWKASPEIYRIFGIDETYPRNLDGWAALIHPDFRETLYKYHLKVEADRKPFDCEYMIIRHLTNETRWVHGLGELEYDLEGHPVKMTGTIQDITDRKKAEEELRISEEAYRAIFENTGTAMLLIEEDMTISKANGEFLKNSGLAYTDIVGKMKWTDFVASEEKKRMMEQHRLRRSSENLGNPSYEFRYKTTDGYRYALLNVQLVPDTKKSVASLIDITRRREAEKKLKISEDKFRTMSDSSPVAIMLHQKNNWIYVNKAAEDISGYTCEELYKMNFWEIVHPDFQELIKATGRKRQEGDEVPRSYEFKIITKSGDEKWVSLTGSRMHYEDKPTALVAVMDITARKKAEEEKSILEAQLLQAQKMEAIGRLAGGVAHDFNNMLGVILGHTELAMRKSDPGQPFRSNLKGIRIAADRSADLTRQLLAFARKQTIAPKILNLNDTVNSMLGMLRRLIGEDIHLVWKPSNDLWKVSMDPSQIDQILANLCINARDAIEGVGKMTIETGNSILDEQYGATHAGFHPGEYVMISVSDNGCGMDKETMSHIFEPFFTTKGVNKGTGLGLATVYGAVKQNNGFINAYSEPGQGSTFTIYLPRYLGNDKQYRKKAPVKAPLRGQETILLVEDEPSILEVTSMILNIQGYTAIAASNPTEAISLAQEHTGDIHLLLTDVVMPEMNGRDLAKHLRALYPGLKILFMSGYTANVIAHHGVLDEGVQFIQKPFTLNDLAAKIRETLSVD